MRMSTFREFESDDMVDAPFVYQTEGLDANGVLVVIEPCRATKVLKEEPIDRGSKNDLLPQEFWRVYDKLLSRG